MRLIDADALMREFAEFVRASNNSDFADVPNWNDAVSLLGSASTIDAVPVVRCKNCEFYTEEERWCRRLGLCGAFDPNGYCSHGERSEDGRGEE